MGLLLLIGLPLAALLGSVNELHFGTLLQNSYIRNVVSFSLWQASLSTLLAVGLSIPVAFSLARQADFFGRQLLIRLFSMSLIIPTVVGVFGIIAIFGNNGWLKQWLAASGIQGNFSIYGLTGILIAHVFFNLPLSARIILNALEKIPAENWRLASQLGITSFNSLRLIQWPVIRSTLPGIALLVFSLCFTSFAIVMTLGGGPGATTIEVAIYQALRFEFNLDNAVGLALIQMGLCLALILFSARFGKAPVISQSRGRLYRRRDGETLGARLFDFMMIGLVAVLVCLPITAIFQAGLNTKLVNVLQDNSFWQAATNTLLVSLLAGSLAVLLACGLLITSVHLRTRLGLHFSGRLVELSGSFILVIPPLALGTGLFLLLRDFADVFALALVLTVLINALMGLPFAIRVLENPMLDAALSNDRLCSALGIEGLNRLRIVEWPLLRKPFGLALAFSSTLAAGDLTVIALFGSQDVRTLPLLLYQNMGSYRLQEAAVIALLLLLFCLLLFWLLEILVGGNRAPELTHVDA
ncbi:MAG: thiamine/thiamine pyrophosphate ABC transporter permease [Gammaproteobacteria bacterium]|nr:thiamine/thiamine pyrophosphate ABC transporter permease [Gammaproteobacteria bacterium]